MRKTILLGALLLGLGSALWFSTAGRPGLSEISTRSAIGEATALTAGAEAPGGPTGRAPTGTDLPPEGSRSLFDFHVAQLGALPYPFSALVDSFRDLDRWQDGSVRLLIPDGRSLRKGVANYEHPRVLAAAQVDAPYSPFELAPLYTGRLFMGFVEPANEIEVISYNEVAGRYEYQLVKDYCQGCVPRIVYARRVVCLTCHQSGAPIFSVRPWKESNAHAEIARRIAGAREVPWAEASSTLYHGAPISTQLVMPETFDELAGLGSEIMVGQKIWWDGCGPSGVDCRRQLLAQVLFLLLRPGEFHPHSAENQRLRELQGLAWPQGGIARPDDNVRDRNPLDEESLGATLGRRLAQVRTRLRLAKSTGLDMAGELKEKLMDFDKTPRLPEHLDPLAPRPPREILDSDTLAGVQALVKLFDPRDRRRLLEWSGDQPHAIRAHVLAGRLDDLLDAPLNRVTVMRRLATVLGHAPPDYCCQDADTLSPPRTEDVTPLEISSGSVLEVFRRYCFACHRGNPSRRLDFMGGKTEEQVLTTIRSNLEIMEVLDYERYEGTAKHGTLMPPRGSDQRAMLDEARAQNTGDLERMREALPALFDF